MPTEFSLNAVRFEDVYQGIVSYLKENHPQTGEFDFGASNISYQISIASYMTMLMAYRDTLKANNIFIDTTEIRKNAISIAKTMGYRPKRKVGAKFSGKMEYFGDTTTTTEVFVPGDTITIPARTQFVSSPNGYTFTNPSAITLSYESSILLSGDFTLTEGTYRTITTFGDGTSFQSFTINSDNVEEDNLDIYIRNTNTDATNNVKWVESRPFFASADNKIYFIEEDIKNENKPIVKFGDEVKGQIPKTTETITAEYLETLGDSGNEETLVVFVESNPTVSVATGSGSSFAYNIANLNIEIPELQVSFSGADNETLDSIQFNAPKFFDTGGRGIVPSDFDSLLADYSILKYWNVIGGNVLFPLDSSQRGLTYITAVPAGISEIDFVNNGKIYLSILEENQILPDLTPKSAIATSRTFAKPTYIFLDLNPYVEVGASLSNNETTLILSNVETGLDEYIDDNLRGLGKAYRHSKLISDMNSTPGVVSSELDVIHNFIINGDSFYESKETRMNLPIINSRDTAGAILYDDNSVPITTTFTKKRKDIIDKENETRLTVLDYDQFTLPINLSSIYGSLYHINSDRELYNIDVAKIEFLSFELVGPTDAKTVSFDTLSFQDQNGLTYVPNLIENGVQTWLIQLNGRTIGTLNQDSGDETIFTISGIDTNYLSDPDNLAIVAEDTGVDLLQIKEITETDEQGVTSTYYSIFFFLTNELFTDVRIGGITKWTDAIFDGTTFKWTYSNTRDFTNLTNNPIVADDVTLETTDENAVDENFVQVNHTGSSSDIVFSMKHNNGTFTLRNFVSNAMNPYTQRNDLLLKQNFTLAQESSALTYSFSGLSSGDSSNIQIITLKAQEITEILTVADDANSLDGKYFVMNSAGSGATSYYVWFTTSGDSIDPAPSGKTGIKVDITTGWSAALVAASLADAINALSDDFTAVTDSAEGKVTVTNADFGQASDAFDGAIPTSDGEDTGFTFNTIIQGDDLDLETDLDDINVDDLILLENTGNANNNGYFVVQAIDLTAKTVKIYNSNAVVDASGIGTMKHYVVSSGTYGDFTVYGYDIYHNVSVGTLEYNSGDLTYKQTLKGYTDFADIVIRETDETFVPSSATNNKTVLKNIKSVFDNYDIVSASPSMDKIKINSIDNSSNSGEFLGQLRDFDEVYNISIQGDVQTPVLKR